MNEKTGGCVGVIVRQIDDEAGNIELFLVKYQEPVGVVLPWGHIEDDEPPLSAAERVLHDDTGLKMTAYQLLFHDFIKSESSCHETHEWWIYRVDAIGEIIPCDPGEHNKFIGYESVEVMREYMERGEVDPTWFCHILPALGII